MYPELITIDDRNSIKIANFGSTKPNRATILKYDFLVYIGDPDQIDLEEITDREYQSNKRDLEGRTNPRGPRGQTNPKSRRVRRDQYSIIIYNTIKFKFWNKRKLKDINIDNECGKKEEDLFITPRDKMDEIKGNINKRVYNFIEKDTFKCYQISHIITNQRTWDNINIILNQSITDNNCYKYYLCNCKNKNTRNKNTKISDTHTIAATKNHNHIIVPKILTLNQTFKQIDGGLVACNFYDKPFTIKDYTFIDQTTFNSEITSDMENSVDFITIYCNLDNCIDEIKKIVDTYEDYTYIDNLPSSIHNTRPRKVTLADFLPRGTRMLDFIIVYNNKKYENCGELKDNTKFILGKFINLMQDIPIWIIRIENDKSLDQKELDDTIRENRIIDLSKNHLYCIGNVKSTSSDSSNTGSQFWHSPSTGDWGDDDEDLTPLTTSNEIITLNNSKMSCPQHIADRIISISDTDNIITFKHR